MKRYLAELIGTFMLVFFGTGAIIVNELYQNILTPIGIALSFGLTLMVVIYTLGDLSGAHLNPAVSLGFWLTKRFPRKELVRYVIAQCVGALLASTFLRLLFPSSLTLGTNSPSVPVIQAFVLEFLFTLVLMFTILNVSTTDCKLCPKTASPMVGITVGATLTILALFGGSLTGASMNPARSLAPAFLTRNLDVLWLYILAPCMGAIVAVPLFKLQRFQRELYKSKVLAESIGTFMLVFFGTGAIVVNELYEDSLTPIGIALSFGLTLMVVIYTLGDLSGAHLNPAVSLGFWFTKRFSLKELVGYLIAQCVGALLASTFLWVLFYPKSLILTLGTNSPSVPVIQAFVLEFLFTLVLMFTILNVSTTDCKLCPKTASPMVGITVGATLTILALFGGSLTGASMNPARSLAPAFLTGNLGALWLYILAPCIGAIVAVPLFKLQRFQRELYKSKVTGRNLKGVMRMSSIICPECGHANQLDSQYCDDCGIELPVATPTNEPFSQVKSRQVDSAEFSPWESSDISASSEAGIESAGVPESLEGTGAEVVSSEPPSSVPIGSEELGSGKPETISPQSANLEEPIPANSPTVLDVEPPQPVTSPTILEVPQLEGPQAVLIQVETGERFELPPGEAMVYIGKVNEELPVQIDLSHLPDANIISRIHAAIGFQGKAYYLEDSGSLNGTSLNGEALKPGARFRRQLKAGDTITFGRHQKVNFTFELEE